MSIPTTRALIEQRQQQNSQPGKRTDPYKLALVIEGGGMRGVIGGGMVMALQHFGLRHVFDVVYGTSVGAYVGAYFLAHQSALGTSLFYQELCRHAFISPYRLLSTRPVMNLDYVIGCVVNRKPLNLASLIGSDIPLKPVASCHDTGQAIALEGFRSPEELLSALYATALVPYVAGSHHVFDGKRYVDGCVTEPLPIATALREGATHVLALSYSEALPGSRLVDFLILRGLRTSPHLTRAHIELQEKLRSNPSSYTHFPEAEVDVLKPINATVSSSEKNIPKLLRGLHAGAEAMASYLGQPLPPTQTNAQGIIEFIP